jgi:hypothetical protein
LFGIKFLCTGTNPCITTKKVRTKTISWSHLTDFLRCRVNLLSFGYDSCYQLRTMKFLARMKDGSIQALFQVLAELVKDSCPWSFSRDSSLLTVIPFLRSTILLLVPTSEVDFYHQEGLVLIENVRRITTLFTEVS